jgi:transcriptional regulator with XRE-family HTH domain
MTNLRDSAAGELGHALVALIEGEDGAGTIAAFAKRIGRSASTVARWVTGDKAPDANSARKLCRLWPDLRPMLEAKLERMRRRKRPPLGKQSTTTERALWQRELHEAEAAIRAGTVASPEVKEYRRLLIAAAAETRNEREKASAA